MTATVALLLLALQLLTAVQQATNLPESLRQSAIAVAQQAIAAAQAEGLNAITQIPQISPIPVVAPVAGGTQTDTIASTTSEPMAKTQKPKLIAEVMNKVPADPDPSNNMPYGEYRIKVTYLNADQKTEKDARIHMDAPDSLFLRVNPQLANDTEQINIGINALTNHRPGMSGNPGEFADPAVWYAVFSYIPTSKGVKTITFTGDTAKVSMELDVQ